MSRNGKMNGSSPKEIGNFANGYRIRYKIVILCDEYGVRYIASYGLQEKYDSDRRAYEANPERAKVAHDEDVVQRYCRRHFSSPKTVDAFFDEASVHLSDMSVIDLDEDQEVQG